MIEIRQGSERYNGHKVGGLEEVRVGGREGE